MAQLNTRRQQLQATFSVELEERVATLRRLLRTLEHDGSSGNARRETVGALFRAAHSLKGAARAVELGPVEQWAHALESALDAVRRTGDDQPTRGWFDAAYCAVDAFGELASSGGSAPLPQFPAVLAAVSVAGETPSDEPGDESRAGPAPGDESRAGAAAPATAVRPSHGPQPAPFGATAVAPPASAGAGSVRVSVGKLDTLLAQAGELAVTRIRIGQRVHELHDVRENLYTWGREWRACRGLRATLRRISSTPDHGNGQPARELDALLRFTEQAEARAQAVYRQVEELATQVQGDLTQLGLVTQGIADEVLAVRLLPVATIVTPFERMVRDLARAQEKDIHLVLEGSETEIDRKILEQLRDPLMHMVRNAVDHGIERPDERGARGKPRAGTIRLTAAQRGSAIEIDVQDDGAGLDPSRLRASAVRKRFLSEDQATALDDQAAMELIFQPGFSTSATVTETSGRGVGLDVVRAHVERLNGHVRVSGSPGRGTRFTIGVPLTLATTRAILVKQSGQIYAIPSMMTERSARVREQQLISLEGRRAVAVEGHPVPVVELADVLERPRESTNGQDASPWRPYFILRQDDRRVALLADGLLGEQEIVVKSLGWPLRRVRNVGGAAVLGSGQTVAILNPFDLLKTASRLAGAVGRRPDQRPAPAPTTAAAQPQERRRRRILVVDDSLPTRTLVRSILEAAGYATTVATDGTEALAALHGAPVDLVVSDIEMPGLDGFALTAAIRRDEKLRQIPVVLVTSLAAREHRERGVAAGADAYIVKGSFDQGQLLDTVGRLIA